MMIDWNSAPEWATHYGSNSNWAHNNFWYNDEQYCYADDLYCEGEKFRFGEDHHMKNSQVLTIISTREKQVGSLDIEVISKDDKQTTSVDILDKVKSIQQQRAAEYEQDGGERSFAKIATIYNTLRGTELLPSDIALILTILKDVRAYSQDALHMDSIIDKVSYSSLWGELIIQERGGE